MTQHMLDKEAGKLPKNKMFIYSGHDLTLVNVWQAMGFKQLLKPEYGAALIVELHSVEGLYQVQVTYLSMQLFIIFLCRIWPVYPFYKIISF